MCYYKISYHNVLSTQAKGKAKAKAKTVAEKPPACKTSAKRTLLQAGPSQILIRIPVRYLRRPAASGACSKQANQPQTLVEKLAAGLLGLGSERGKSG